MSYKIWIAMGMLILSHSAQAQVLWAGGEDVDFPNGGTICNGGNFRTGYSRFAIASCAAGGYAYSKVFPAGAITSGWLSVYVDSAYYDNNRYVGFGKSGTTSSLWIGTSSGRKLALYKFDGTTWTMLAEEAGVSFPSYGMLFKADLQVISYGASATLNLYINGLAAPVITYSGNVLAGSAVSLDQIVLGKRCGVGYGSNSEIIVSAVDSRKLSLVTLAPNAAGDSNTWTGAYTNINPAAFNDASVISTATSANTFQSNLSDLPSGTFTVKAVKVSARMTQETTGVTSVALGVKTNATVNIPAAVTQEITWGTTETFYLTNPVTAAVWTATEINALQINLQSAP